MNAAAKPQCETRRRNEIREPGSGRLLDALFRSKVAVLKGVHAEFLGQIDQIGTIETGKAADLVVIHGDPSSNIKDLEKVEIVFKDGIGYDSEKMIDSVRGLVGWR